MDGVCTAYCSARLPALLALGRFAAMARCSIFSPALVGVRTLIHTRGVPSLADMLQVPVDKLGERQAAVTADDAVAGGKGGLLARGPTGVVASAHRTSVQRRGIAPLHCSISSESAAPAP